MNATTSVLLATQKTNTELQQKLELQTKEAHRVTELLNKSEKEKNTTDQELEKTVTEVLKGMAELNKELDK
jgi:hypothetical protein